MKNILSTINIVSKTVGMVMLIMLFNVNEGIATDNLRSRLKITYEKLADNTKMLSAKLNVRLGKRYVSMPNATITFSLLSNDEEMVLGVATTDEAGVSRFYISKDYPIPMNEENYMTFMGHYSGNDSIRSATSDVEVKDCNIQLLFNESIKRDFVEDDENNGNGKSKSISIVLTQLDSTGNKIPVTDELVTISVARLYSLLQIEEGTTDDNGVYEFEFSREIPGDSTGNLIFVAKIEDSFDFGYVTASEVALWGTPVNHTVITPRALWSDQAPIWMIVGVIIVLGGAWFNFFIAMRHLYKCFTSE